MFFKMSKMKTNHLSGILAACRDPDYIRAHTPELLKRNTKKQFRQLRV
jgi:hypothetical protein